MGFCGCLCGDADAYNMALPDWMVWSDHPIRQQFDVVMDLGEGSFAQVRLLLVLLSCLNGGFRMNFFCKQVVLGRRKDNHNKFAALKVVFLGNPELEADHLAIMKQYAAPMHTPHPPCCIS